MARMRDLPAAQRQALALRELEGRSYEEISAQLGHSGSGVRQLIFRARTALRNGVGGGPALRAAEGTGAVHAARVSSRGDRRLRAGVVRGRGGAVGAATLAVVAVLGGGLAPLTAAPGRARPARAAGRRLAGRDRPRRDRPRRPPPWTLTCARDALRGPVRTARRRRRSPCGRSGPVGPCAGARAGAAPCRPTGVPAAAATRPSQAPAPARRPSPAGRGPGVTVAPPAPCHGAAASASSRHRVTRSGARSGTASRGIARRLRPGRRAGTPSRRQARRTTPPAARPSRRQRAQGAAAEEPLRRPQPPKTPQPPATQERARDERRAAPAHVRPARAARPALRACRCATACAADRRRRRSAPTRRPPSSASSAQVGQAARPAVVACAARRARPLPRVSQRSGGGPDARPLDAGRGDARAQYVFSVRPVSAAGSVSECAGELSRALRWYPPFQVRHVSRQAGAQAARDAQLGAGEARRRAARRLPRLPRRAGVPAGEAAAPVDPRAR